jgi:hypothetical protein
MGGPRFDKLSPVRSRWYVSVSQPAGTQCALPSILKCAGKTILHDYLPAMASVRHQAFPTENLSLRQKHASDAERQDRTRCYHTKSRIGCHGNSGLAGSLLVGVLVIGRGLRGIWWRNEVCRLHEEAPPGFCSTRRREMQ